MQIQRPLRNLLKSSDAVLLSRGSKERTKIRPLQMLLYGLGYGQLLNWDRYAADGDYGGGTTKALTAFMQSNGLGDNGAQLNRATLEKLLTRYDQLELIRKMVAAQKQNGARNFFDGIDGEADKRNLEEWSFVCFDSKTPSTDEINTVLKEMGQYYGDGWLTSPLEQQGGGTPSTQNLSNKYVVRNNWVRVSLTKNKKGVWTVGNDTPLAFIEANGSALRKIGLTNSAVRVITPVSANEGNLNAINSWDNCFMTFGMFQWTLGQAGGKGELPALLRRLKENEPKAFEQYFGTHGLDVTNANRVNGYVSLNGQQIDSVAEKERFRQGPDWAFRFWLSGLDFRVKQVQIMHAIDRINQFVAHPDYQVMDKYNIRDLITSEYGMCLILDHHVNRPGHLTRKKIGKKDILGQAMVKAGLQNTDPSSWTTTEEMKLISAYLPLRYASSMTHSRERAAKIKKYADKGLLSSDRRSFRASSTRNVAPVAVDNYPLVDFKEYEERETPQEAPEE